MTRAICSMLSAVVLLSGCTSERPDVEPTPEPTVALNAEQARVVAAIAAIDSMRSARAATIVPGEPVTAVTFARVCQPVGLRARELAAETGWTVRQAALRYRNPGNEATLAEAALIEQFEADPELVDVWSDGPDGSQQYTRRITVEPACLVCHGREDQRPDFIVERYPDDLAHGFDPGDLRGVYSVLIPEPSARSSTGPSL